MVIIIQLKIHKFHNDHLKSNSLYLCAGGFEDRSLALINQLNTNQKVFNYACLCEYDVHQTENITNVNIMLNKLKKTTISKPTKISVGLDNVYKTSINITNYFDRISKKEIDNIYIDVSGMSNFLTLITLAECYRIFVNKRIYVIYAEAEEYYPTTAEAKKLIEILKKPINLTNMELESFTSTGSRDFFPLPQFRGNFDEKPVATFIFVGYEPIRVSGFLNQYRPSLLITLYGVSPHKKFIFRTEYSRKIHSDIFKEYLHYEDKVSTFYVDKIFEELKKLYRIFFQEYNISIFPQNSKLQTVACFLFVKEYPDVQLVYCLPGKFNPRHYSRGIGDIFIFNIK